MSAVCNKNITKHQSFSLALALRGELLFLSALVSTAFYYFYVAKEKVKFPQPRKTGNTLDLREFLKPQVVLQENIKTVLSLISDDLLKLT